VKRTFGIALALTCSLAATLKAQNIYVASAGNNTIGEYGLDGRTVNASLITGLSYPAAIAISGGDLFVANAGNGTIGEYTTAGATVNASLITGLGTPASIAISGGHLFVLNVRNGTIGEYTTDGATINASLITGLNAPTRKEGPVYIALDPVAIAISGNDLFVARGDTIFEYTAAGATVNTSLITGLAQLSSIAVSGNDLFVGDVIRGIICKYTTTGATIAAPLITGMTPAGIAIWRNDLFVVDTENGFVYKFGRNTTPGTTVTKFLIIGLNAPTAIAVAPVP
jgi:hypothetical protein